MSRSPKLLKCTVTVGSALTTTTWNATISGIVAQQHPAYTDPNTGRKFYNGFDVNDGDYITTVSSGKCLKITNILNKTDVGFTCILVDDQDLNRYIDTSGDGRIVNGEGYIFEIVNNVPALFPLPSGLGAGFNFTFASQLLSRFISNHGLGGGSLPNNVLTTDALGNTVASLDGNKKLTATQIPSTVVLTNDTRLTDSRTPLTHTHNEYVLTSLVGDPNGVAPLISDKLPTKYLPSTFGNFETVDTLPPDGDTNKFYILRSDSSVWKWTGTQWVKVSSEGVQEHGYTFITISVSDLIDGAYQSFDKQIITVLVDCTIILPDAPINGYEIIILNNSNHVVKLTTVKNQSGDNKYLIANAANDFTISSDTYSTYLIYTTNDWQFSSSKQLVNVYTQQPGSDQYGPSDYWPAGTVHNINDTASVWGKDAIVENWTLTNSNIAYVIKIGSLSSNNRVQAYVTSILNWSYGDKIKIVGATGNAAVLNSTNNTINKSDYWVITKTEVVNIDGVTYNVIHFTTDRDLPFNNTSDGMYYDNIGTMTKITEESLAEQITIFDSAPSDNFSSIWFPKSGLALQRDVTFNSQLVPSMKYSYNLLVSLSRVLGFDWRLYHNFEEYSVLTNLAYIMNSQDALDVIASKPDFIRQYINSNVSKQFVNPTFGSSNSLIISNVGTFKVSSNKPLNSDDAYRAFDGSLTTHWVATGTTGQYLLLNMTSTSINLFPHSFTIYTGSGYSPKFVKLEYNDGLGNYHEVGTYPLSNDTTEDTFYILKPVQAKAWKFSFIDSWGGTNSTISITDIKIRGWSF